MKQISPEQEIIFKNIWQQDNIELKKIKELEELKKSKKRNRSYGYSR